jgi:hypothetical protein
MRTYRAVVAVCVIWVFLAAAALSADDPFVRYTPPAERKPRHLLSAQLLRMQVDSLHEAERLFALGDHLAAAIEYDRIRHGLHEAHDWGFLANQVEHAMVCWAEVIRSEKGVGPVARLSYDDGSTRYVLSPAERPAVEPVEVVLVDRDGTRSSHRIPKYGKLGAPSLPAEWYDGLRGTDAIDVLQSWKAMVAAHSTLHDPGAPPSWPGSKRM